MLDPLGLNFLAGASHRLQISAFMNEGEEVAEPQFQLAIATTIS